MTIIRPFIHQSVFMQAPYRFLDIRFFYLIGGYACGKTSGLSYATIEAIRYFSGKRDKEGKRPKIVIAGITLTFLKKTLVGALVSLLQSSKSEFNYDKAHNIIYVGGVEILLVPIENPDEIFGYDVTAILVDELDELPTHISIEVVRSLNDRCRQQIVDCRSPFMMFGTTSQGLKGTYKTVQNFKKIGMNYLIVRGKTKNNTSLPKDYVEAMYRIYNEKEISCLLEGNFVDINAGNVYPDFLEGDHAWHELYQKIEDHETIYIGQDFNGGFNKAVAGVVREGVIYIVKEYTFPDIRRAPEVFRYDFPKNKILWIPDATNNQHLPSYRKELKSYRIKVVYRKTNPLVKDRTFLINKIFHADRMRVCDNCQNLIQHLMERQNDPKTGLPMKGKGEDAPDHDCDALEYMVTYIVAWKREMKDIYSITIGRRLEKRAQAFEEGEDQMLHSIEAEDIG